MQAIELAIAGLDVQIKDYGKLVPSPHRIGTANGNSS